MNIVVAGERFEEPFRMSVHEANDRDADRGIAVGSESACAG